MTLLDTYYLIKPLIPRSLQILLRRLVARGKLPANRSVWPIDRRAATAPAGWKGWPGGKPFAFVLSHDVDTARGHDRCLRLMELERSLGFRSTFYFVPEGYAVSPEIRSRIKEAGFDVGVHGLLHDGKMFRSRRIFDERAVRVNRYLKEWNAVGFSSPSMHRNLDWVGALDIAYDISTFDTDPFEPQPDGVGTIFPFWVARSAGPGGFLEIPYTLPQDHSLFIIFQHKDIRIWKEKLDWIAEHGGLALVDSHPDYMNFDGGKCALEEYPVGYYADLLNYVRERYEGCFWHARAKDVAEFWGGSGLGQERTAERGITTRQDPQPPPRTRDS